MDCSNELIAASRKEAERIEEDSLHSGKAHFDVAARWNRVLLLLGIPATTLSVLAGAAFVKTYSDVAALLSLVAAVLTALITFLKPTERASAHKIAADRYLALRNDARVFREIDLLVHAEEQSLADKIKALSKRRNDLNQSSPEIPRWAFVRARKGIAQGEASYSADKVS